MDKIKQLLVFALLILVMASCKEEDPRPDYYYRFKVDGVQKEFKATKDAGIVFLDEPNSTNRIMFFTMVSETDPNKNSLVISLRTTESVQSGTEYRMQEPLTVNNALVPRISFLYFDENAESFGATLLRDNNPGARDNATLIFTQITTEGSYGEFSAVIFDMEASGDLADREAVLITDGEFFLPNFASQL